MKQSVVRSGVKLGTEVETPEEIATRMLAIFDVRVTGDERMLMRTLSVAMRDADTVPQTCVLFSAVLHERRKAS